MSALPAPPDPSRPESGDDMNLASPIFVGAAGMVGVCLTVIGVFRAVVHIGQVATLADDLVAANALIKQLEPMMHESFKTSLTYLVERLAVLHPDIDFPVPEALVGGRS